MPLYSFIIVKVGLVIACFMAKPFAKPLVIAVFPAPSSPFNTTVRPAKKFLANFLPKLIV